MCIPDYSSVRSSLKRVMAMAAARAREEKEAKQGLQRAEARRQQDECVRAQKLVEARRRRRLEKKRDLLAEMRAQQARLEGIREGELVKARIAADHEADLQRLALQRSWERELRTVDADRKLLRMRALFCLLVAASLLLWATLSLANQDVDQRHRSALASGRAHAARLELQSAELRERIVASELRIAELRLTMKERAALDVDPPAQAPSLLAPAPGARRPLHALPPKKSPPPPPAPVCDDASGDPCCAFGQILC